MVLLFKQNVMRDYLLTESIDRANYYALVKIFAVQTCESAERSTKTSVMSYRLFLQTMSLNIRLQIVHQWHNVW